MKGEWSYYGGHFNGRKNGHVTEVVTLMEGEWSCTEVVFNGGNGYVTEEVSIMSENGHVTEVASLNEGEWSQRVSV